MQLPTDAPTRTRNVLVHKWCVSEETCLIKFPLLCPFSMRKSTSKSGTRNNYFTCLRSSATSTFKCLIKDTPLCHEHKPQEPQRSSWPQEKDAEWSAPNNAHHTHCAPRQLGTTADQRYDVPQNWLWDACLLARVRWGTRREGTRSEEQLYYHIRQSGRNPLEQDQVQRALGKFSRSCHRTCNNQPLFTSLVIPWGFLAWAVLCGLSRV